MANPSKPEFLIRFHGDALVVEEKNLPAGQELSFRQITCAEHNCLCSAYADGTVSTVFLGKWWKITNRMAFARELVNQHLPTGGWNEGEKLAFAQKLVGILQLDPPA